MCTRSKTRTSGGPLWYYYVKIMYVNIFNFGQSLFCVCLFVPLVCQVVDDQYWCMVALRASFGAYKECKCFMAFVFSSFWLFWKKERKSGAELNSRFIVFFINFCCTCFLLLFFLERIAKEK